MTKLLKMRLVEYVFENVRRFGVEKGENGNVIPVNAYKSTLEFLRGGKPAIDTLQKHLENVGSSEDLSRERVKIVSPIANPDKVICIGLNYRDHCAETGAAIPKEPIIFNKFPSAIVGPYDPIQLNQQTNSVDWEVELVVVIGTKGKNIPESSALDHVFGYTVANDVSARDWQLEKNGGQWLLGKTMDTFCPLGPAIVAKHLVTEPHNLSIECRVNGVSKQKSNTKEIIHNVPKLVSYISKFATLLPGDLILTGTPPGVGFARNPPEFLKAGDVVECQIENIGAIKNPVV